MDIEFGAIEVPAEANPLTEGILFHVLRSASSTDPNQIQTGTKQLQEWGKARGYYPLLQACVSPLISRRWLTTAGCIPRQVPPVRGSVPRHHSAQERHRQVLAQDSSEVCLPPQSRCMQHTLTGISAVNKEDRNTIRVRLLESAVNEADNRLALQNALMVAKIVRFEYPNDWYLLLEISFMAAPNSPQARCFPATHPDPSRFHRADRLPPPAASSAPAPTIHC